MLEQLFPKYHQRYVASPFGDQLELFARGLTDAGYRHDVVQHHVCRLRQVLELGDEPLAPVLSRADLDQLFAAGRGGVLFAATRRAFARCLADLGRWWPDTDVRPHAQVLEAYRDHLNAVRGLSPPTVAQHVSTVAAFLEETLPAGLGVSDLTREQIEHHVVATGKRISRQSLQHWVARLRSFLRFCHMLVSALSGTYHAFDFAKYAHRYLAEVQYRFNRRFNLASILPRLQRAACATSPRPAQFIRAAEVCR